MSLLQELQDDVAVEPASAEVIAPAAFNPPAPAAKTPKQLAWERWRPQIEEASKDSFYPVEQVEAALASGKAEIWPGKECAIITEVERYPNGENVFRVWWGVGNLQEQLSMRAGLEAVARAQGCTSVLIEGREGWEKSLKAEGFTHYSTLIRKAL